MQSSLVLLVFTNLLHNPESNVYLACILLQSLSFHWCVYTNKAEAVRASPLPDVPEI